VIDDADVLLVSVRRRVLPPEQMAAIRRFIEAGKPVVGIRTASHAFSLRNEAPPEGLVAWESFDADVIGGSYTGHHGNDVFPSIELAAGAAEHSILAGVDVGSLRGNGSLYKVNPLASSATPLLVGSIPNAATETIAWTNENKFGGRVFYTALGHAGDFELAAFQRLLKNGIYWAAGVGQ
jgi:type 1 glutamine amidotransferase